MQLPNFSHSFDTENRKGKDKANEEQIIDFTQNWEKLLF